MNINRYIRWYDKENGDIIGEEEIIVSLELIQQEFNVPKENPMYDCWKIDILNLAFLKSSLNQDIDLSKYDYFIEADYEE